MFADDLNIFKEYERNIENENIRDDMEVIRRHVQAGRQADRSNPKAAPKKGPATH